MIKIAVVMPNRNDKKYLPEAINSVLKQRISVNEFFIIDDCSDDGSPIIIEECIKDIPYAKLLKNNKNLGVMSVLNQGLEMVTSDYVIFLASNDLIDENFTYELHQVMKKKCFENVGVISGLSKKINQLGNKKNHYSGLIRLKTSYLDANKCSKLLNMIGPWFMGSSMLFNVKQLKQIQGFNTEYGGLADMYSASLMVENSGAVFLPKVLGYIREHNNGYLQNTLKISDEIMQKMAREIAKQGGKNSISSEKRISQISKLIKFNAERNLILISDNIKIICDAKILFVAIKNYGLKLAYHFYYRKIKWLFLKY